MRATVITIGDELLIGQTIDTNSAWMGQQLNALGVDIIEVMTVNDERDRIVSALDRATAQSEVVLMTGGLGPTKDDITKHVLADYFGMGMRFDQATYDRIVKLFAKWGRKTTDAHRQQSYMPDGAELLENGMGTAPGMLFQTSSECMVVSMPGVPYEMKYIVEHHILPRLKERSTDLIIHKTLLTSGKGESRIAELIQPHVDQLPPHISVAYLPSLGTVRVRLTSKTSDRAAHDHRHEEIEQHASAMAGALGDLVFGYDDTTLPLAVGNLALEKGLTIGTAESCTGGLVANKIVTCAGASRYFQGSTITYSYASKHELLRVREETLSRYGAVSEETVVEMVSGAVKYLGVDVVVAVSGIAGPSGGTPDKPVGTIWMACGDGDRVMTQLVKAGKNREKNIEYASNYALNLMRKFLLAH